MPAVTLNGRRFAAADVLAGAYRGRRVEARRLLVHVVELDEEDFARRVLCHSVDLDHLITDAGDEDPARASCPRCIDALTKQQRRAEAQNASPRREQDE